MQVSIDISLYPLNEKFIPPIDDLMSILKVEIEKTFKKEINSVLNLKIVNGDSRKYD